MFRLDALPIVVIGPGIARQPGQPLLQITGMPLGGGAPLRGFIPADGHGYRQTRTRPNRMSSDRTGAELVAKVINENLADPIARPHLGREAVWQLPGHEV